MKPASLIPIALCKTHGVPTGKRLFKSVIGLPISPVHITARPAPYRGRFRSGLARRPKVGIHGATPTAQRASADQAVATDLASVITLTNELRAALVEKGLIRGGA